MALSASARHVRFLVAMVFVGQVHGQGALEVIPLRHRTADQVLPTLRPLMEPGAVLTGQGSQLIVRTSPANLAELKRALDDLDRPLRRLQISVRFDDALERATQGVETSGRITNRGSSVEVRAQDRQSSAAERVDQRVQVLEGGRAFISTGGSIPLYDGSGFRETSSGFEAIPRLAGGGVLVEIAQRRETLARQQGMSTTVSGRLGEWLEIGGAVEAASRDDSAILSARSSRSARSGAIWLKVDEVRP
jgi:type II secretory pathway component GspD/PulD (secretin)